MNTAGSKRMRVDPDFVDELKQRDLAGKHLMRLRHRKRKPRKPYILIGVLLLLILAGSVASVGGYLAYQSYIPRYHDDLLLAQSGVQHLQKARSGLEHFPGTKL
jgi:hypothetical protein